jgi:hypothetical protein
VVERRELGRSQSLAEGLTLFFLLVCAVPAGAQPAVTGTLSNVTRVESWSYFLPYIDPLALTRAPIGDPDYTFVGDRAELGVRVDGSRFDLSGAFNYVRLENLPTNAIGPGALGPGAFYFAATGVRYSYQLYLSELTARFTSANAAALTVGRMPFSSGHESVSENASLERLKSERLASRLIGNFEWSLYQRRFDGVRFDLARPNWHVNAAAFFPTQGGYEESTNLTMPKVQVGSASLTHKAATAEWQLFGYAYRDRRGTAAVVDNTFALDQPVDVTIGTAGASYVRVSPTRAGELDVVLWGAAQAGDWYGDAHRGASFAAEAGHRWTAVSFRPWLRGGYLWASGDRDRQDDRHGTFFQMIPSSRQYALSSIYTQMNLRDAFVQLAVEPRRFRARIEVHALQLASGADLWYQGSGATASSSRFFGFAGRAAGGDTGLGAVLEGAIDVPIRKYWSINGYAGTMSAGSAVTPMFTSKRSTFWSIENVIRF